MRGTCRQWCSPVPDAFALHDGKSGPVWEELLVKSGQVPVGHLVDGIYCSHCVLVVEGTIALMVDGVPSKSTVLSWMAKLQVWLHLLNLAIEQHSLTILTVRVRET